MVWLYDGRSELLSARARDSIENDELRISPIVVLELELLREIGRLPAAGVEVVHALNSQIGLHLCDLDFQRAVDAALELEWTRDPFDRVIAGHARAGGGSLLTRDETIRRHLPEAIW